MKWINVKDQKPVLCQYFAVKDHEGNISIGIYTGEFTLFPNLPPLGIIIEWTSLYIMNKNIYFDDGSLLTDEMIYILTEENHVL